MKFAEYPFVRYLPFFVGGIILSPSLSPNTQGWLGEILLIAFGCFCLLIFIHRVKGIYHHKGLTPFLAYVQLVLLGMWIQSQRHQLQERQVSLPVDGIVGYTAVVIDHQQTKPNSKLNRVRAKEIYYLDTMIRTDVEVLLYHRVDTLLVPGSLVWISQGFDRIEAPLNPQEFDYQRFMSRQGVHFRQFLSDELFIIGHVSEQPIERFFQNLRFRIQQAFEAHFDNHQAKQIANALLLGQKKDLDKEVSDAYATAGAMHILAVSGLHVGIIYGFFFLLVKPYRLTIRKRVFYLSFIILIIWCYALVTGMSPSVMRSATMFTIIGLAQMKSRSPSIFNAIALSAFLLLLFDPNLLYSVGFQLSYSALVGILLIQPLLVTLWLPSSKIVDYCWQITTVGVAAQVATFPLSALYFGIFPTYFMLSNLIAIPGAFLIMSVGVPYMLFSGIPGVADGLAWITEQLIRVLNTLISLIQLLPAAKLTVTWQLSTTWIYLIALVLILFLCYKPHKFAIAMLILLSVVLISVDIIESRRQPDPWIVHYSLNKGEVIDYFVGGKRYSWEQAADSELSFKVTPYRTQVGAQESFPLELLYRGNTPFLLIPDFGLVPKDSLMYLAMEQWQYDGARWQLIAGNESLGTKKGARKYLIATQPKIIHQ
ncbi:ComEC/Rec2 family competence protein [Mongoliitalea daihaiensis]|uniref:ComEC/Rec2 family competence protein n=1 Tax=Mongoliitalea daihaiensis TaxID=2782006 RepID=UPI001F45E8B7|nr:ComEC/Rec2 family competence protein [Mongoliitalea daihaiensis]UJP66672.1 ComEC/Rec2 family competence protein [Mongoliitalea daihaiensis]